MLAASSRAAASVSLRACCAASASRRPATVCPAFSAPLCAAATAASGSPCAVSAARLLGQPPRLAVEPCEPRRGLAHFGFGHAPFGLDPGVVGGGLGQRQLGRAAGALGILGRASELRPPRLVGCKGCLAGRKVLRELLERFGGIAGQPVGLEAILLEPRLLPVEVGEALLGCLELARQRRHAVPVRAGVVTPVGELVARFGELPGELGLRLLRFVRRVLRRFDARVGVLRLRARGIGRRGRVAPAREQQPRLGMLDLVGQGLVALGLLGLPAQRGDLAVEPGHQVLEPGEVGFGLAQLAFGIAPADVKAGDARRFLEHHTPLGRLGGDHRGDLALADEGGAVRAGRRVGEDQRDVLGAHVAPVDAVGAARAALDPAGDLQLLAVAVDRVEDDLGEIARQALRGAGEDHVVHPARAHRLGRCLAHDPADRFEQV